MYQISGGGYGGNAGHDGLSNGCSTIGISKSPPVEVMEQAYPVLYRHYALREGSGGAGKQRGGFGLAYEVEILRGEARASFVMDHGRFGPQGACGGSDGMVNAVTVFRGGEAHVPPHLSKEQDIRLAAGDRVRVGTPGGGGYGDPLTARSGACAARRRDGLLHARAGEGTVRSGDRRRRDAVAMDSDACNADLSKAGMTAISRSSPAASGTSRPRAATAAPASRR